MIRLRDFKKEFHENWLSEYFEFQVDVTKYYDITMHAPPGSMVSINNLIDTNEIDSYKVLWGSIKNQCKDFKLDSYLNNLKNSPIMLIEFEYVILRNKMLMTLKRKEAIQCKVL